MSPLPTPLVTGLQVDFVPLMTTLWVPIVGAWGLDGPSYTAPTPCPKAASTCNGMWVSRVLLHVHHTAVQGSFELLQLGGRGSHSEKTLHRGYRRVLDKLWGRGMSRKPPASLSLPWRLPSPFHHAQSRVVGHGTHLLLHAALQEHRHTCLHGEGDLPPADGQVLLQGLPKGGLFHPCLCDRQRG